MLISFEFHCERVRSRAKCGSLLGAAVLEAGIAESPVSGHGQGKEDWLWPSTRYALLRPAYCYILQQVIARKQMNSTTKGIYTMSTLIATFLSK